MKQHIKFFLIVMLLGITAILATGCGKKGNPSPRQKERSFVWQQVNVTPLADCLEVTANMSGVYNNLDTVILELSGVNSEEDCPGCPFLPRESYTVDHLNKIFNRQSGVLAFSYCPLEKAQGYRWRLIGTNIYDASRHAISPEGFTKMPD